MLNVTKKSANRLDIDLSGTLDAETMNAGLDALVEQAEGMRHGRMLYRIADFEMPTMGALAVEFQHMPKLFGLIGKFDKCAVLSDIAWIRTMAEMEGAVIPGLAIRSFPLADKEAAEAWLEGDGSADLAADAEKNVPV